MFNLKWKTIWSRRRERPEEPAVQTVAVPVVAPVTPLSVQTVAPNRDRLPVLVTADAERRMIRLACQLVYSVKLFGRITISAIRENDKEDVLQ